MPKIQYNTLIIPFDSFILLTYYTNMHVQKSLRSMFFDCDDTLILWNNNYSFNKSDPLSIEIRDPYHIDTEVYLRVRPNLEAIELLKRQHAKDTTIVVWSAGGWQWAEAVVKALGLEQYVSVCMSKPDYYVDDLECKEFMGEFIRVAKGGKLRQVDWITNKEQDIKI